MMLTEGCGGSFADDSLRSFPAALYRKVCGPADENHMVFAQLSERILITSAIDMFRSSIITWFCGHRFLCTFVNEDVERA